jgi:hypothetical protein
MGYNTIRYESIRPGETWFDTGGMPIHAHGGSIFYEGGIFYWYGENKEKSLPGSNIRHWGMRCYSSKDLYNWEDCGLIIPPEPEDLLSPLHPSAKAERPHILYNEHTGKYVCWIKVIDTVSGGKMQSMTILTAERFLGPYTVIKTGFSPLGMNSGDFDLVQAPDEKAYIFFERVHSEVVCASLTMDYTDINGCYSTHFAGTSPPYTREAPAFFFRKGRHYLLTSGTTGYFPNPTEVALSFAYHGPWSPLGCLCPDDSSCTSYNSQISSVFKHPEKEDLYIALGDRWISDFRDRNPTAYDSGSAYENVKNKLAYPFD